MDKLYIGDKLKIHCYKHNEKVYCSYDEAIVLDIKKEYIVCGNGRVKVTEIDGRTWRTKEPAILYYFKNSWFNIIGQLKKDGIYFYCNIASPYIIEEGAVKFIDYDLDLRIFPSGEYRILDKSEYKYHKKIMNYGDDLDYILKSELENLIKLFESNNPIFDPNRVLKYHELYKEIVNKNKE